MSRELLTEIQTDAKQQYQTNIDTALSNLSREVGVWPAADDYYTVSAEIDKVMQDLPYNVVACVHACVRACVRACVCVYVCGVCVCVRARVCV